MTVTPDMPDDMGGFLVCPLRSHGYGDDKACIKGQCALFVGGPKGGSCTLRSVHMFTSLVTLLEHHVKRVADRLEENMVPKR